MKAAQRRWNRSEHWPHELRSVARPRLIEPPCVYIYIYLYIYLYTYLYTRLYKTWMQARAQRPRAILIYARGCIQHRTHVANAKTSRCDSGCSSPRGSRFELRFEPRVRMWAGVQQENGFIYLFLFRFVRILFERFAGLVVLGNRDLIERMRWRERWLIYSKRTSLERKLLENYF